MVCLCVHQKIAPRFCPPHEAWAGYTWEWWASSLNDFEIVNVFFPIKTWILGRKSWLVMERRGVSPGDPRSSPSTHGSSQFNSILNLESWLALLNSSGIQVVHRHICRQSIHCLSYSNYCCSEGPRQKQLREERVYLAYNIPSYSLLKETKTETQIGQEPGSRSWHRGHRGPPCQEWTLWQ